MRCLLTHVVPSSTLASLQTQTENEHGVQTAVVQRNKQLQLMVDQSAMRPNPAGPA